ncbi:hypothetical protein [Shimia ponticola]|nr:hypothetical protein [Shimia ponticola]
MLWGVDQGGEADPAKTSNAAVYVFCVWAGVIIAAAMLAPFLARIEDED